MKKISLRLIAMFMALIIGFLSSCEKIGYDQTLVTSKRKPFKMTSETWFRFSPTTPSTVNVNGTDYTSFVHVPGGGSGTATEMGKIKLFFNQLTYTADASVPQPLPLGSVSASVSLISSYPVLGAPLPLIQSGDFDAFDKANKWLKVPAKDASGKVINAVIFCSNKDALFIANTSPSIITPVSPTKLTFAGKLSIVGGRGKYANATGDMDFTGFFNPQNANDAGYVIEGWIAY
jgi:hypothetical protein